MGLLDRPVSVRIEKADFLIVAHLHTVAAGRAGIVAYGFEPTALLFLLVAAMRACRLAGVLSCYDRIIVTGTLPGANGLLAVLPDGGAEN
jgi:hypothetical protein